jgi:hypothetical protein
MINEANITLLTTIASTGFALALLGAVSTLWPHSPTEEGLASFAFALATAFAMVLGNLAIFGAHMLTKNKPISRLAGKISSALAVVIFVVGFNISSILFTEGLNAWFTKVPLMPPLLITFVRSVILISFLWLIVSLLLRIFSKNK